MIKKKCKRILSLALATTMALAGISALAAGRERGGRSVEPAVIVSTGDLEVPADGKLKVRAVNVSPEDVQSVALYTYSMKGGEAILAGTPSIEAKKSETTRQREASKLSKSMYEIDLSEAILDAGQKYAVVLTTKDGKTAEKAVKIVPKANGR